MVDILEYIHHLQPDPAASVTRTSVISYLHRKIDHANDFKNKSQPSESMSKCVAVNSNISSEGGFSRLLDNSALILSHNSSVNLLALPIKVVEVLRMGYE